MTDADGNGERSRYYVTCPNCGKQSGSYSPEMTGGGRMCSCGTHFAIDTDNQQAGEVLNAPEGEGEGDTNGDE